MEKHKITYFAICMYVIEFTVCGLLAWIYETALTSYLWGEFAERGFLHIPVLPIYGFFALLLILIFHKRTDFFSIFFGGMFVTTVLELIFAYIIEAILHTRLWSYRDWDFNFFDGRIALYSSLMFGVMSILLIKFLHPAIKKLISKISEKATVTIGSICWITIISDFIITCIHTLNNNSL